MAGGWIRDNLFKNKNIIMALLDSLNNIAKKSEDILNTGNSIGESVSQIAQNVSSAVSLVSSLVPAQKDPSKSAVSQNKKVAKTSLQNKQGGSIWEKIGCSPKTIEFVNMALADGIIDSKERALLLRRVVEDGVDPQEFDFVLTKALETYHNNAKGVIKEISNLFRTASCMSTREVKPNVGTLTAALPNVLNKVKNPQLIGAIAAVGAVETLSNVISSFIKEPSKLNTFKAEIIRMIDIPLFPEVLIDFFGYASSQINEERQRNNGKGIFTDLSETLFGKDIDLIPIWQEKMIQVMTKTVIRYGNSPEIMSMVSKWRISPLKKLMKASQAAQIENFPIPKNASDYIELLKYSYERSHSVNNFNKQAYSHLHERLIKEAHRFVHFSPMVKSSVDKYRIKPVTLVMSNWQDPVFMIQFKAPTSLSDLLSVLNFLGSKKELRKHHQRIYKEGIEHFKDDNDAIKKIQDFKPKNMLGF